MWIIRPGQFLSNTSCAREFCPWKGDSLQISSLGAALQVEWRCWVAWGAAVRWLEAPRGVASGGPGASRSAASTSVPEARRFRLMDPTPGACCPRCGGCSQVSAGGPVRRRLVDSGSTSRVTPAGCVWSVCLDVVRSSGSTSRAAASRYRLVGLLARRRVVRLDVADAGPIPCGRSGPTSCAPADPIPCGRSGSASRAHAGSIPSGRLARRRPVCPDRLPRARRWTAASEPTMCDGVDLSPTSGFA